MFKVNKTNNNLEQHTFEYVEGAVSHNFMNLTTDNEIVVLVSRLDHLEAKFTSPGYSITLEPAKVSAPYIQKLEMWTVSNPWPDFPFYFARWYLDENISGLPFWVKKTYTL